MFTFWFYCAILGFCKIGYFGSWHGALRLIMNGRVGDSVSVAEIGEKNLGHTAVHLNIISFSPKLVVGL